ncbi:succinate dehydrogenase, cytochrome b556 subunit [Thioclava atlantica]|uniref:Succinate dehydrogenase cytochrome b556 subunit n=1 Tax=Thioclava atlantica TaxID=1317124 RepID=A0A085TYX7_9RHOB|nr:succinate dehydrogenase, cytochrome b556 subunit [Thioclava atlantica]KFE35924.1 succinate dehydrogenase, cytochrome b subunit [Thioclava atlantica]
MAEAKQVARPLSPHLQIYRPQMTSFSSIMTRITGNGIIVGVLLLVWWLLAAATSPDYFNFVNAIATSWFGDLVFTLSLLGLWYHYLAGIRHLIFDTGKYMDIKSAEMLGWISTIGSVVLTILTLIIIHL